MYSILTNSVSILCWGELPNHIRKSSKEKCLHGGVVLTHSEVLWFTAPNFKIFGVCGRVIRSILLLLHQKACQFRMSPESILLCQPPFWRAPTYFSNLGLSNSRVGFVYNNVDIVHLVHCTLQHLNKDIKSVASLSVSILPWDDAKQFLIYYLFYLQPNFPLIYSERDPFVWAYLFLPCIFTVFTVKPYCALSEQISANYDIEFIIQQYENQTILSIPSKWKNRIYYICITPRYLQIIILSEVHKTY